MTTQKSRKNPRAQVTLVARYRSPTAFEYVEEHCSDLSSGGMFIESNAPAPAGTLIKLECDVDEGAGTLKGVARVVWLREQEGDGQPKGMGVKFLKLEPGGRELILQLLGERASLPPTGSIPASRRSWTPSVAPAPRASSVPAASSSKAPPLPRASLTAPKAAEHHEVDPSELSVAAGSTASAVNAATASADSAASAASGEALGLPGVSPTSSPTNGSEVVSGAVTAAAAASAVLAADARALPHAGAGHESEPIEPGAAGVHHDHRPHAHELRERLARRAAAQRAAASHAAAHPARVEAPSAEPAREPSARPAASSESAAASTSATASTGTPAAWQEPARAPEPARTAEPAAASPASVKPESRGGGAAQGAATGRPVRDERRDFALKGDVPVEEMSKGRGAIYAVLIAVCIVVIAIVQLRKGSEPGPAPAVEAPAPAAAAPVATAEPEPAPMPAPEAPPAEPAPAPSYVVEVATTPDGATVELGGQSMSSPAQLVLGALDAPVTINVRKDGFEPASLEIDRTGFALEGGQLRRHIELTLSAPPPPPPPPTSVAEAKKPAATPPAAKKPAAEPSEKPAPAVAAAKPTPAATPKPAPKPEPTPAAEPVPAAAAQSPMQVAMACLATGDNPCVLRALEGRTSTPRELELLIETHRTMGDLAKAEQLMKSYIDKYPSERRATTYRRQLDRKAAESAVGDTAPAASTP